MGRVETEFNARLTADIDALRDAAIFKNERVLEGPQGAHIEAQGREMVNLCANNYLGLANHAELKIAAMNALDSYGFGMASVRFICGTQEPHHALEKRLAQFLGYDDCILYSSCFDANTGLFETILNSEDAIISDALNHASIIDGVRLCKAMRYRYRNADIGDLEDQLIAAQSARTRLIVTDGVFSMDGFIAPLQEICDLAEKYDALVMVDDSHAVGFMGANGRGTPEFCGVADRVHMVTGTLGKALGGASGGYVAGSQALVTWLRQRSRPYLFSNALAPMISAASIAALDLIGGSEGRKLRAKLTENTRAFRAGMEDAGFELLPGEHPIIPVMTRDPAKAQALAAALDLRGIFVTAFSFPVVPRGQDRIRTQMSAALSLEDVQKAVRAFKEAGRETKVIS